MTETLDDPPSRPPSWGKLQETIHSWLVVRFGLNTPRDKDIWLYCIGVAMELERLAVGVLWIHDGRQTPLYEYEAKMTLGQAHHEIEKRGLVTLPQHDHLNDLPQDIRTNWQRFAARVAAHEQRHVDIYLEGAKTMKARMEAILRKLSSCSELEKEIHSLSVSQQEKTGRAQDQFHAEDEAKIQNDRKPLEDLIDLNRARLVVIESEIRGLDQTLNEIGRAHV